MGLINEQNNLNCQFDTFFKESCAPGAPLESTLCKLCKGSGEVGPPEKYKCKPNSNELYYSYAGALRCLIEVGQVAFVKHTTIAEITEGQRKPNWASGVTSSDFVLLAQNGDRCRPDEYERCFLAKVCNHAVVSRPERAELVKKVVLEQQILFGNQGTQKDVFRMFQSDAKDSLFKDGTECLAVPNENTFETYLGQEYLKSLEGFTKCSPSVIWKVLQARKSSRTAVLLAGLCDSGKTLLFVRLLTGNFRNTQTSITDGSALYRIKNDKNRNVTLIDLPGHESLRLQFLDRFKAAARAIVFVVDSVAFQREMKDVAEFLYQLLIDNTVLKNAPPLLIACNKQDVTMAKSSKLIQQQLERELNTLRVTLSAAPSTMDSSSSGSVIQLGRKGKEFDFSQLPMKVEFIECSARGNKGEEGSADINDLEKWLAKIA
ncbi:Signal recognition particle receptor subunit beta [Ophiophagus hannah]|uniref:Signal recognition particle receptor subunit beta n=1 Tax=Ophiophagus hannah TaxID=8665 RepID=V8NGU6_OPHHA|nr:Signal recognition particle receptor subunit beta [Ophiophagus hannah]